MIPLRQFLCLVLILVGSQVQGENTVRVTGRVDTNANQSHPVWIGAFEMPLRPDGEAASWTRVESSEFTLNLPNADQVQLVALRKDSLPIVRRIRPASLDRQIDFKFQDGNLVEGVVLSTDGFPVSNAILRLDRVDLPNIPIPKHVQTVWNSDANGRFKIGGLAPRTEHAIEVELSYVPNETFTAKISNRKLRRLELRLSDAHFVRGHVEDFEQARVSDATVAFGFLRERRSTLNTATDANGEFLVGPFVRSEKVWLRARHDEQGTSERLLATSGERGVELVLTPFVQVVGTVVDASSGKPIDDFTVKAVGMDGNRGYPHVGAAGEISCQVDVATTGFVVSSEEHIAEFRMDVSLDSATVYDLGVVALELGRQLTGQVFDAKSMQPIEGATVSIYEYEDDYEDEYEDEYEDGDDENEGLDFLWLNFRLQYRHDSIQTTTNEAGEYVLQRLPLHATFIQAVASEYSLQTLDVDETTTVLDIRLERDKSDSAGIRGRVETNEGEPLKGEVIFDGPRGRSSTRVGSDGLFDYATGPGPYYVHAITHQGASDTKRIYLDEDEFPEVRLVVDSKGLIRVAIKGLEDREKLSLQVYSESRNLNVQNLGDIGNGEHVLEGVGLGKLKLWASTTSNRNQTESLELSETNPEATIELNFSGSSKLYGTLRFPDGTFPNGEIRAIAKERGKSSSSGYINPDGTYEIKGLDDGEYTLYVMKSETLSFGELGSITSSKLIHIAEEPVNGGTELDIRLPFPSEDD